MVDFGILPGLNNLFVYLAEVFHWLFWELHSSFSNPILGPEDAGPPFYDKVHLFLGGGSSFILCKDIGVCSNVIAYFQ